MKRVSGCDLYLAMRALLCVLPVLGCVDVEPPTVEVESALTAGSTAINPIDTGTLQLASPLGSCTATLLSNTWAVTAKHCVVPNSAAGTSVTMGPFSANVVEVISRENTDLSVLRLGTPIPMYGSTTGYVMNYFARGWSAVCCGVPRVVANCRGYGSGVLRQSPQDIIDYLNNEITLLPRAGTGRTEPGDSGGTCTIPNAHGEPQMLGVLSRNDPFNGFEAFYEDGDREGRAWIAMARIGHRLKMRHSALTLGVSGGSQASGARVVQGTAQNQQWRILPISGSTPIRYKLHADHSGKCLSVDPANNALIQETCTSTPGANTYQRWNVVFDGIDTYQLTNDGAGNACIDTPNTSLASGEPMQVFPCHGGLNQKLFITADVPDGAFEIALNDASIDVPGWSTAIGQDIQQFLRNSGSNQFFRFTRSAYGFFIKPKYTTGLCLGLEGNGLADGTRIELQACGNAATTTQQFNLVFVPLYSKPSYRIANARSNKCIEGSAASPAPQWLIQRTCNAAVQLDSRLWVLRP